MEDKMHRRNAHLSLSPFLCQIFEWNLKLNFSFEFSRLFGIIIDFFKYRYIR